jgi:hypothetical protein
MTTSANEKKRLLNSFDEEPPGDGFISNETDEPPSLDSDEPPNIAAARVSKSYPGKYRKKTGTTGNGTSGIE